MVLCISGCSAANKINVSIDNTSVPHEILDGGNENQCTPNYCPIK